MIIDAIFFHGAGLLIPYYFGVVRALEEQSVDFTKVKLGGSSAGAIVATMLALGLRYRDMIEMSRIMIEWRRTRSVGFFLKPYVDQFMSLIKARLKGDLDILASSIRNLHIQVTSVQNGNVHEVIMTRFHSYEDLVHAVYGSCNIVPFFSGFTFIRDEYGRKLLDGAFCGNCKSIFEDRPGHITVSATMKSTIYNQSFSFIQVITHSEHVTQIIECGYKDAWEFLCKGTPLGVHGEEGFVKWVCFLLDFFHN
jgi:hypothetical protein